MKKAFMECYRAVLACEDETGRKRCELFREVPDRRVSPYIIPVSLSNHLFLLKKIYRTTPTTTNSSHNPLPSPPYANVPTPITTKACSLSAMTSGSCSTTHERTTKRVLGCISTPMRWRKCLMARGIESSLELTCPGHHSTTPRLQFFQEQVGGVGLQLAHTRLRLRRWTRTNVRRHLRADGAQVGGRCSATRST